MNELGRPVGLADRDQREIRGARNLPADLGDRRSELLGGRGDGADVSGRLLGRGGDGGGLARRLGGARSHGLGGGLELGGGGGDDPDDAADRPLEAVGELQHGPAPLGRRGLVGDALALGLISRLLGDHRLDALNGAPDRADLVAAPGLADLGVDLALRHAL